MGFINFLGETKQILEEHGKMFNDVRWIGNIEGTKTVLVSEFVKAADFMYDNGFGGNVIALDLVIVGDDWWLERAEYDGSEWWEYKTLPTLSSVVRKVKADKIIGVENG